MNFYPKIYIIIVGGLIIAIIISEISVSKIYKKEPDVPAGNFHSGPILNVGLATASSVTATASGDMIF